MNKVILMGRLTRDVELRQTASGISAASFSIAVDRRYSGNDTQHQADFIRCVAWRQTADFISKYFSKGRMIAVIGSIQTRSWDGDDEKKHYSTEVNVSEAYFTGEKNGTDVSNYSDNKSHSPNATVAQRADTYFTDIDVSEDDLPF